jgi:hypothetical protein
MMNNEKYKSLLERAKELREAAVANATKQVLEETADTHRKLIYDKLNKNAHRKLNENIYEDDEESALDKLLKGDEEAPAPDAPDATTGTLGTDPDFTATPAPDATAIPAPEATNDVDVNALDLTGDGTEEGETSEEDKIDPKDVLELTDEDIKDLDADKLRELISVLRSAYQSEEIVVPEAEDGEVSLEIPETGEESPEGGEQSAGLQGDESGDMDSLLASGGGEEGAENDTELDQILSGSEDEEDEQGELSLESKILKRQKQLIETVRKKKAMMQENADKKILLQDENEELEEAEDNSLVKEEVSTMDNKLSNLRDKLRKEIAREKRAMTGERSEKTLNESLTRKLQRKLDEKKDAGSDVGKLQEQIEVLRHERNIYSRRLKSAREKLQERDEKLGQIENELNEVTNYTLRYSTLQKLFTNNPLVRRMNEAQKEEVIDIIDSVKGLPKAEAKKKLDEIYRDFQEETRMLSEGKRPVRSESRDKNGKKSLNESRKRPMARGDVKPILNSKRNRDEDSKNLFESQEIKRMLEIADVPEDDN